MTRFASSIEWKSKSPKIIRNKVNLNFKKQLNYEKLISKRLKDEDFYEIIRRLHVGI